MNLSKENTQVTAIISKELAARLEAYAAAHRWSRSAAIAALIEDGLATVQPGGRTDLEGTT